MGVCPLASPRRDGCVPAESISEGPEESAGGDVPDSVHGGGGSAVCDAGRSESAAFVIDAEPILQVRTFSLALDKSRSDIARRWLFPHIHDVAGHSLESVIKSPFNWVDSALNEEQKVSPSRLVPPKC